MGTFCLVSGALLVGGPIRRCGRRRGDSLQIKSLTLGLSLLISSAALAQHQVNVSSSAESPGGLAELFNSRLKNYADASGVSFKPGKPELEVYTTASLPRSSEHYKVRNGDCDWTIARKFDTTIHKLHLANPQIEDWDALRNGAILVIPTSTAMAAVNSTPAIRMAKADVKKKKAAKHFSTRSFVVTGDDNDWVIAHHLGVPLHIIHELNPNVNWRRLGPGKHILVPSSDGSESSTLVAKNDSPKKPKVKINRLHSRYAVVNSDAVSIRRDAGQHAKKITTVDRGTRVVVLDRDGTWYKLRFPRGTEGWVRGDFLNASNAPAHIRERDTSETRVATRHHRRRSSGHESLVVLNSDDKSNPILKHAVAMRGTPYSYGESSRSGTDCSGFTWQVYKTQGVKLPRTSREQSEVGQPIKSKDLKPGDLLFFGSRRGRGVHHVAIYVGKGKFIHASSGGGKVQFNSLSDDYYRNHYKGARRVVKLSTKKSHSSSSHHANSSIQSGSSDTNPTPLGK